MNKSKLIIPIFSFLIFFLFLQCSKNENNRENGEQTENNDIETYCIDENDDEDDYDTDMSNIDFSNIEKLYEQPLPVIKKCVQGKWQVYSHYTDGIIYNITNPENSFIEFKNDYYIAYNEDDSQGITYFTWGKHVIEDWRSPLYGYKTYMMCDKNQEDGIASKLYFKSIHNDTLSFGTYRAPIGYRVVKVK